MAGREKFTASEDSLQHVLQPDDWWVEEEATTIHRGRLLKAFIPHVDQQPLRLVVKGRADDEKHDQADYFAEPLFADSPRRAPNLPVAGLPERKGEVSCVYRAKLRPVLVLAEPAADVESKLKLGSARWLTSPTLTVAPFYGADQNGTRGGYPPLLVDRIRHCEYPQFLWDSLPFDGSSEVSILRLDHIQPVSTVNRTFKPTPYRLTNAAMAVVDEWLHWLWTGTLSDGSSPLASAHHQQKPEGLREPGP